MPSLKKRSKLAALAALLVMLTTTTLWVRYYLDVPSVQDYHLMYALFAFAPALMLCLCLSIFAARRKWATWLGGTLLLPAALVWILSIMLVLDDFKIH